MKTIRGMAAIAAAAVWLPAHAQLLEEKALSTPLGLDLGADRL